MFAMMNPPVPILGVVENMAYFPDPATGARIPIFGEGGARAEAARLGAPFLGEVPIDIGLREGGDAGRPVTAVAPESAVAGVFVAMGAPAFVGLTTFSAPAKRGKYRQSRGRGPLAL